MTNLATSEVVAIAWLKGVPGLVAENVGMTLPEDVDTWRDSGFVQFVAIVGGSPHMYVPQREPVVQVDLWAVNPDSFQPPWGKARELAERIIRDTWDTAGHPGAGSRDVSALMPADYEGAYVQSVWCPTEPRRIPGDGGSYAHLTMDVHMVWKST